MERKKDRIKGMLSKLVREEGLDGAVLISRDGLVIVTEGKELDAVAAMTAVGVASLETAASEWKLGPVEKVEVETPQHMMVVADAGPEAVLAVAVKKGRDVSEKLKGAGKEIEKVLG